MVGTMLDTNVCIRVLRDRPRLVAERFRREAGSLAISTIVLYELLYGAANSARPTFHREQVADFQSRLTVLPFDEKAGGHAAEIRAELGRDGRPIGPNDVLIAGHARSIGARLVTGNLREFGRVEGLRCEDWLDGETAA